MKIIYFSRKPGNNHFSIEAIFSKVTSKLPEYIDYLVYTCSYDSKGIIKRLLNILDAWKRQEKGAINHITGDIHYLSMLLQKRNTVLTIHDCNFINRAKGIKKWLLKTFWLTLPLLKVKYITTVSTASKKEIIKHTAFNEDRIIIIPNFVRSHFKPSPKIFNHTKPTILQIGTKANKNIERLIKAIKGLNVILEIVGNRTEEIQKLLDESEIEHKWFYQLSDDQIYERYVNCDILAFTSTEEGLGLPILEAQAVGRVVLTSKISSMPEVAGDGAEFVDPFSVEDMRKGIENIILNENRRNQHIKNGFENVKKYEIDQIIKQYVSLYKRMM